MVEKQESKFPSERPTSDRITLCALLAGGGATASQAQRSGASDAVPPESRPKRIRVESQELAPGGPVKYKRAFDDATSNTPTGTARLSPPTTTRTRLPLPAVNRTVAAGRRLGRRPHPQAPNQKAGTPDHLPGPTGKACQRPQGHPDTHPATTRAKRASGTGRPQAMTRPRRWEESGERPRTECRTSGRGRSRPPKSLVNPNPQDER